LSRGSRAGAPRRDGNTHEEATDGRRTWFRRQHRWHRIGGVLVIVGIVLTIVWSFWVGLIVTLVGLIAFGGFAKGKWY